MYTLPHYISMSSRQTIGFSYRVADISLQKVDEDLQVTNSFITREIIDQINEKLKDRNFKVDEASLRPKYLEGQLFLDGFAAEIKEPKTVGFLSGR